MDILVVEDEPAVQVLIKRMLEEHDYEPILADSLASAHEKLDEANPNVIILDLYLPDGNGFELCEKLREQNIKTPILVLSGESDTDVKVKCINAGVDDYLTKPFEQSELVARINALIRRSKPSENQGYITRGGLTVNKVERTCTINDNEVRLTNNEMDLLAYLMKREGEIVSRYTLSKDLWNIDYHTPSNFVNVYISYLRKKIREHSSHEYIKTIRNKGFVFVTPNGQA